MPRSAGRRDDSGMAHAADIRRHPAARWALGAVEGMVAVSAAGGAMYGLSGAEGVDTAWLQGSPFSSYVIPSLVLLIAVGGSAAAALAGLLRGSRRAPPLAVCAGAILVGWIAVEVIWIPFSPLQPACLLAGLAMIALGRVIDS
jgi:hypothetical protein